MFRSAVLVPLLTLLAAAAPIASGAEPIRLASGPALSPDGSRLVFSWAGDLWIAPSGGGDAERLTTHPGPDTSPSWSPDGAEIAFTSDRGAGRQVFLVPAEGGVPRPLTFDTNGARVEDWFPDGEHLLVTARSDLHWRHSWRFYRISRTERRAPELLFDAYGSDASVSPDGDRILFTREGVSWWRKGYRGSRASQVWLHDRTDGSFREILREETGCRWPLWLEGGDAFLYVGVEGGAFNLVRYDLKTDEKTVLTSFPDDSVVAPAVSADGKTVVFRHLFDLYRLRPGEDDAPAVLPLENPGEPVARETERRRLDSASEASFTDDGLEIAFTAGDDVFVMDTVLREPVAITSTPAAETEPVFLPDASAILFLSDAEGKPDVFRAERADPDLFWWQSTAFRVQRITDDPAEERHLTLSPDGSRIAFVRGIGTLVTADPAGGEEKVLLESFDTPDYSWSPDSRWIAYAVDDEDFNRDVWIVPADGSAPSVNVSRHPDNEWNPTFSPDGRILAFVGRRMDRETDIHYVWLREEDEEKTGRDRKLEEALEKMQKARKKDEPAKEPGGDGEPDDGAEEDEPPAGDDGEDAGDGSGEEEKSDGDEEKKDDGPEPVVIDFEEISRRVKSIRIADVSEGGLFWAPEGQKLAFVATIDGRRGVYTVEFPDELHPKHLQSTVGSAPAWGKKGIRWVVGGKPAVTKPGGKTESFAFSAQQVVDRPGRHQAAFEAAWRAMRDRFYDPTMNHRDWDAIRGKYRPMARAAPDRDTLDRVVDLMLGELNASHLGFRTRDEPTGGPRDDWSVVTGHPGFRTEPADPGPGLRITHVFRDGPADRAGIVPGEILLAADGRDVSADADPTTWQNGPPGREIRLLVRAPGDGAEPREVRLVPTTLGAILGLAYEEWVDGCRAQVEGLSEGRLGYVHIRGMNWSSFFEFEREIYDVGYGREGLVIDVRDNGGGFTADHLLTILTQPEHAFTVPRGGSPGYPQDRRVYATWSKPIVVLVNQGSFSNAEIFAHAIRTLGRGRLVGVPTAGGVISTGGMRILDIGGIRTPGRGWFVLPDGEDMERNGAQPHVLVRSLPRELDPNADRQLETAVRILYEDVEEWSRRPEKKPRYASGREPR